jgi:hypothetical protein
MQPAKVAAAYRPMGKYLQAVCRESACEVAFDG